MSVFSLNNQYVAAKILQFEKDLNDKMKELHNSYYAQGQISVYISCLKTELLKYVEQCFNVFKENVFSEKSRNFSKMRDILNISMEKEVEKIEELFENKRVMVHGSIQELDKFKSDIKNQLIIFCKNFSSEFDFYVKEAGRKVFKRWGAILGSLMALMAALWGVIDHWSFFKSFFQ